MNIRSFLQRIEQFIRPPLSIGGLEVNDAFLRYVSLRGDRAITTVVRLLPGVLDNGMIINRAAFAASLRGLYQQLVQSGESISVVATIASSRVYTQAVRLPAVPAEQYEAALDLNLRASSPLDATTAYYDAELLGFSVGNEREFLAAFVDRALIDSLHDLFVEIGFVVVAMEFPALSAARVVATLGRGFDAQQPLLLVSVVADGVDLMIVRDGHLLFHHWQSFRSLREHGDARAIDIAAFQAAVSGALTRTLNFYTSQWSGMIHDAILLTRGVASTLQPVFEQFALRVIPFVATRFDDVASTSPIALGAALRGLISRRDDVFISLAPMGTEAGFVRAQFWRFVFVWRWALTVVAAGIFLLFLITDVFLARQQSQHFSIAIAPNEEATIREAQLLRDQAVAFNRSVDFIAVALTERGAFSSLLADVRRFASNGIVIKRIAFQARDRSIAFTGHASSGFAAIDFKTMLAKQSQFENVVLPFARITPEDSGVLFQLTAALVPSRT